MEFHDGLCCFECNTGPDKRCPKSNATTVASLGPNAVIVSSVTPCLNAIRCLQRSISLRMRMRRGPSSECRMTYMLLFRFAVWRCCSCELLTRKGLIEELNLTETPVHAMSGLVLYHILVGSNDNFSIMPWQS